MADATRTLEEEKQIEDFAKKHGVKAAKDEAPAPQDVKKQRSFVSILRGRRTQEELKKYE